MARAKSLALDVSMNGQLVGQYIRASSGRMEFRYAETWLQQKNAIALSLSLPLQERPWIGDQVNAVFENLLPDNAEIRRIIAERSGAGGTDAFSLLARLGRDCVGALQFIPAGEDTPDIRIIEAEPVPDRDIAEILNGLASAPLGYDPDSDFRISIAGAQEKTALLRQGPQWFHPRGATPTTHILKPAIGMLSNGIDMTRSVENEWLCMTLAREFGLPTADCEMADFDGTPCLVVHRFDRQWSRDGSWILRLPQEDILQSLGYHPEQKYENAGGPGIPAIMEQLKTSDRNTEDRLTFLRAQIVFWMMAATDGHAKNFSIFLRPNNSFRLTPLYDILSVDHALAAGGLRFKDIKLAMAVGASRHYRIDEIFPRHWAQTAKQCDVPPDTALQMCRELANTAEGAITRAARQIPDNFPDEIATPILDGIRKRAAILSRTAPDTQA